MSWRDVPMPPQIDARPREVRGYPVPYVSQSIPERHAVGRVGTADDGPLESLILTTSKLYVPGHLEENASPPWDLGEMNWERQRRCQIEPACQVCGRTIVDDELLFAESDVPKAGERHTYLQQPPVCASCMIYALQVCPALLHQGKKGALKVYTVRERELIVEGDAATNPDRRIVQHQVASLEQVRMIAAGLVPQYLYFVIYNVVALARDFDVVPASEWLSTHQELAVAR